MGTSVRASVTIEAPRERVFGVFSDIPGAPARVKGIERVEMIGEGPVGVGTAWRETRVMFGKLHTETLEITAFDAPESYEVGSSSCGTLYRTTFTFREVGPARTEVEFVFEGKGQTFMARVMGLVMSPLMKGMMRKCMMADLMDLKGACEGVRV